MHIEDPGNMSDEERQNFFFVDLESALLFARPIFLLLRMLRLKTKVVCSMFLDQS